MGILTTIGLDVAKNSFQVHGADEAGAKLLGRKLQRKDVVTFFEKLEPIRVGIEASSSAHFWGRILARLGHDVRLMQANYVRAYVKSQKNDMTDAEAICEAVRRPNMRFVPIKTEDQQAILVVHQVRRLFVEQYTKLVNAFRGHLAEFGVVARVGRGGVAELADHLREESSGTLPETALEALLMLADEIAHTRTRIHDCDRWLLAWHRRNAQSQRLVTIPGIGVLGATAMVAKVSDVQTFASGRALAAWLGLVPRQHSTGGVSKLGHITKRGDPYLRQLLVLGARNVLSRGRAGKLVLPPSVARLLARKPFAVAGVALANRMARVAWALMTREETYRQTGTAAPATLAQGIDEARTQSCGAGETVNAIVAQGAMHKGHDRLPRHLPGPRATKPRGR